MVNDKYPAPSAKDDEKFSVIYGNPSPAQVNLSISYQPYEEGLIY
jgi:hypothetical protein